jgi:hypothetical protein
MIGSTDAAAKATLVYMCLFAQYLRRASTESKLEQCGASAKRTAMPASAYREQHVAHLLHSRRQSALVKRLYTATMQVSFEALDAESHSLVPKHRVEFSLLGSYEHPKRARLSRPKAPLNGILTETRCRLPDANEPKLRPALDRYRHRNAVPLARFERAQASSRSRSIPSPQRCAAWQARTSPRITLRHQRRSALWCLLPEQRPLRSASRAATSSAPHRKPLFPGTKGHTEPFYLLLQYPIRWCYGQR